MKKYRVGDRVRLSPCDGDPEFEGQQGTVSAINDYFNQVKVEVDTPVMNVKTWPFDFSEVERIL